MKTGTSTSLRIRKYSNQVLVPVWVRKNYPKKLPCISLNCRTTMIPVNRYQFILQYHPGTRQHFKLQEFPGTRYQVPVWYFKIYQYHIPVPSLIFMQPDRQPCLFSTCGPFHTPLPRVEFSTRRNSIWRKPKMETIKKTCTFSEKFHIFSMIYY